MKTNILIVDDKLENINALKVLIEASDTEILSAQSAEEALALLMNHDFGLAILDVQMPGTSGFELARLIRGVKKFKHLPIIFVTAHSREQAFIFEGYETGAVDLMFKPIDPYVVRSKVRVFIQIDQQNRKLKEQLEENEKLRQQAESANLAKGRFLANMSHEIRTPLGAVMGFADILSEPNLTDEEKAQYSSAIRRNGQLLLRIIDDILDFSKIEAQRLDLERIEFRIEEILKDIISVLRPGADSKGIGLKVDFQASLGEVYISDPVRLKQILFNLLGNAIKFTSQGEVSIQLEKQAASNPEIQDRLVFRISDTGIGLSDEQQKNIFMPFAQADSSTKRQFGGTGLGLVIAKQLAKALNGDLILETSAPQKGSVFRLHLDLEKRKKASEVIPNLGVGASSILLGKRILIVDDIEDNRTLLQRFLAPAQFRLQSVGTGEEALEIFKNDPPDLVLMDVQMPGMDGYETTRSIRKLGFQTPILALTAHTGREEIESCKRAGYDFVLTKPVNRQALFKALVQYLNSEPGPNT